jgi:nucleotide-binding universal stress UspA family protein
VLKNILVPLDGSAFAQRALPYAQMLARRSHAQVIPLPDRRRLQPGGT